MEKKKERGLTAGTDSFVSSGWLETHFLHAPSTHKKRRQKNQKKGPTRQFFRRYDDKKGGEAK